MFANQVFLLCAICINKEVFRQYLQLLLKLMDSLAVGLIIVTHFFSGISSADFTRLQSIQNSLAHFVRSKHKYDHPTLKSLHWLPVRNLCDFKVLTLVYN
jgi:hypothetical protein